MALLTVFENDTCDPGMTLEEKAFAVEPRLPELYAADEDVQRAYDNCAYS